MYVMKLDACSQINGSNLVARALGSYGYKRGENKIVDIQA